MCLCFNQLYASFGWDVGFIADISVHQKGFNQLYASFGWDHIDSDDQGEQAYVSISSTLHSVGTKDVEKLGSEKKENGFNQLYASFGWDSGPVSPYSTIPSSTICEVQPFWDYLVTFLPCFSTLFSL